MSQPAPFVKQRIGENTEALLPTKQAVEQLFASFNARAGSFGRHPQRLQIGGAFDKRTYMYFGMQDIDLDATDWDESDIGKVFTFIECGEINYWGYDGFEEGDDVPATKSFTIEPQSGSCSVLMLIDIVEGENIFQLVNTSTGVAPNPPTPKFSVTVVNGITNKHTAMEDEIVTITSLSLFIDPRDNKTYGFKTMPDGKNWLVENFDYNVPGSWYYDNLSSPPFTKAGRLYTWDQAIAAVPAGWHLPTDEEWTALALAVGGTGTYGESGTAGNTLKAISGWNDNGNGVDTHGFAALPGGNRIDTGTFNGNGFGGLFWTATADGANNAFRRTMSYDNAVVGRDSRGKDYGFSVRLVKDT